MANIGVQQSGMKTVPISAISSGESSLYTIEASGRMFLRSLPLLSFIINVTRLCSAISGKEIGLKTPFSNIASTVLVMIITFVGNKF